MKREPFLQECEQIKQNCEYTAEAHHIIANDSKNTANLFQILPAVIAAVFGVLAASNVLSNWAIWLSAFSAGISVVGNILNPLKDSYDHQNAAKHFTVLKHDARALYESFGQVMDDKSFVLAVQKLHDRYNDLVSVVPPTTEEAFKKAREKIKSEVHQSDKLSVKSS